MADVLTEIRILGLIPSSNGVAVFLGNDEKTFSIQVDHAMGTAIAFQLRGEKRVRPLTHDLINLIFQAFTIKVQKIIINDLKQDTYFARLVLTAENEIHRKVVEIDARPSDCIALAAETKTPLFVSSKVWNAVSDVKGLFEKMKDKFEQDGSLDDFGLDDDEDGDGDGDETNSKG